MRTLVVALVALGVLVGTGCWAATMHQAVRTRLAGRKLRPDPDSAARVLMRGPTPVDTRVPLDRPIPFPIPIHIGSREVMLPTGSTVEDEQSDPGGEIITVRRGDSHASFAADTGAILEWDILPEDELDLEPRRPN